MTETKASIPMVFGTAADLAAGAADWLIERLLQAETRPAVCLSGGSTPKAMFELLAQSPRAEQVPWQLVHWFYGDERFVPHDHKDSNYRMSREALFQHVPVLEGHVHPFPYDGMDPGGSAMAYETTLQQFYGATVLDPARPLFDVVFLGLGEDGHTASLFPGTAALDERSKWVTEVKGANKPEPRLSLTYPALNSCRAMAFLVSGTAKRDILRSARRGAGELPAARVQPLGDLFWMADADADPDHAVIALDPAHKRG